MYLSMSSPNPRKRPAPGAGPVVVPVQYQQPYPSPQEQLSAWNGGVPDADFTDPSRAATIPPFMMSNPNQYTNAAQGGYQQAPPSNAIARRQARALVPTGARPQFDAIQDPWPTFGDEGALIQQPAVTPPVDDHDNVQLLEEKAARAKREAQANRKQIPPFVQKLSSFLEEAKNTDLIRWSQKGDSFIVLDEDEFAKTLIPELFKHNNYASFVRQLNMYGFHKRVGLSDNSMKASERKNKSPSEYYNPYFKRGHPNLLWLINKPKSGGGKKKGKKEDGEGDSEEETVIEDVHNQSFVGPAQNVPRTSGQGDTGAGALQKKDLQLVRDQIGQLRDQQRAIHSMIQRLRQDHNQLYQQAVAFQNMHERHENSINAILNFLANVFRKSLEEQGGAHSVSDLLASIIPNGNAQMPQGSVVDLGDFIHQQSTDRAGVVNPPKRQQRLLPPIPHGGKASTVASSPASVNSPPYTSAPQGRMGSVTELFDSLPADTTSPDYLKHAAGSPQEQMMKIINDTNAGSSSGIDLSDMAAKTPVTMSSDQRNQMINIMARQANMPTAKSTPPPMPATTVPIASSFSPPVIPPTASPIPTPNLRAKGTPPPPHIPTTAVPGAGAGGGRPTSLSPVISSMPPPPSLHDLSMTQAELDALQRLQEDQRHKIDELSQYLGPLSPSGRIPGIDEAGNPTQAGGGGGYFPENIDIDQFLDPSAFANGLGGFDGADFGGVNPAEGGDFDFSLDGAYDGGGSGAAPITGLDSTIPLRTALSDGRNGTPSPATTEEIYRNDVGDNPIPDPKRRRMG